MEIVHADMNGFKNDVDSLTAQLSVMGDPARQDLFFPYLYQSIIQVLANLVLLSSWTTDFNKFVMLKKVLINQLTQCPRMDMNKKFITQAEDHHSMKIHMKMRTQQDQNQKKLKSPTFVLFYLVHLFFYYEKPVFEKVGDFNSC